MRQQLAFAVLVVGEAAAGQHHAAPCRDLHAAFGCGHHGAGHALALAQQAAHGAAHADVHAALQGRGRQRRDQRVAVDQAQAAPVQQPVAPQAQHQFRHVPERRGLARRVQEVAQLGARGDAQPPQRGLGQRRLELGDARAQAPAVEGRGADRAAAGGGVRRAAVEVGDRVAVDELQRGALGKEPDHARRVLQEAAHARLVEAVAQFVAQVGQRALDVLGDARRHRERVARDPHPAARPGGGAAEARLFLGHDHPQAQVGRGHGGRQPARARADHQQVAIEPVGRGLRFRGHRSGVAAPVPAAGCATSGKRSRCRWPQPSAARRTADRVPARSCAPRSAAPWGRRW